MLQNFLFELNKLEKANIIFENIVFTAKQLIIRSLQLMEDIKKMDPSPKKIAFLLPNSPELLCWQLACFHLGIPIIPIIYEQNSKSVEKILMLTQPDYFFTTSEKSKSFEEYHLPNSKLQIINDSFNIPSGTENEIVLEPSLANPDALAMIIFSSGTSGDLKGIMHSYRSAYGFIEMLQEVLTATEKMIYVIAQPMGHIGGITTTLLTLKFNGTAILLKNFEIKNYIEILERYMPTHINLHTPLFYEIIHYPKIPKQAFKNIITAFAGGDEIPNNLPIEFMKVTGAPMQIGYGSTEVGIMMVHRSPYADHIGSCGKKISSAVIELRNAQGNKIVQGEIGEIWAQTKACCLGYWNRDALNDEVLIQNWFKTGDLAYLDADGYYWYKGRANQMIHRGSHIVYPFVIEQALFDCSEVKIAAVVSLTDKMGDEMPVAFVELKNNDLLKDKSEHETIVKKLNARIANKLEPWEVPQDIIIINNMPLNLTGKIDRMKLKMRAEEYYAVLYK